MKKFSVWLFSLIVLFYSFASAVPVKASSPTFNIDYSNLLSASQISGLMSGLSASGLSALYNSLGGLGYAYLQSVNVDVKSSSPSSVLYDLGEMVYNFIVNPLPNQVAGVTAKFLYDVLSPQTKYQVSTLVQDAASGSLNESNYNTFKYEWKTQVSEPMSDIFNTYNRVIGFSQNPDAFVSISSLPSSSYFFKIFDQPFSSFINSSSYESFYSSVHLNFPTVYSLVSTFPVVSNVFTPSLYYSSSYHSFDSVLFFDSIPSYNFTFVDSLNNSIGSVPSNGLPFLFFDSSNPYFYGSSSGFNLRSSPDPLSLQYNHNDDFYTISSNSSFNVLSSVSVSSDYDRSSLVDYFLGYSSKPSFLNFYYYFYDFAISNVNVYYVDISSKNNSDSIHTISLSDLYVRPSDPISIDSSNVYQGSLQVPIDNAPDSTATLDIQSVIDAINDNSLNNNIDRLGDIISDGIVGSIPTYSVDAWSPDAANEYVHVSDLSLGLEGVQSLEGTFTDNVQPVFDSFPLFPFIAPIWNTFQQYPVIGLITACIFLVVLFGFLNKLLF